MRGNQIALDAVKYCWASLWTAYRTLHTIAQQDLSLPVVIQELVPAEAADILFTANPLTGERDHAMINAAWGLGEAIVSGQVTPDTTVIEKASDMPKHVQISKKHVGSSALCVI